MATSDKNTREDFNYQAAIDKMTSSVVTNDDIKRYPDSKFIDSEYSESYLAYNVYEDFDCTLVRTDLGKELVNEFYILQIIYEEDLCSVWTRTGKIGEVGKYNNENFGLRLGEAIDYFESKYNELTGYTRSDTKGGNSLPSPGSCSGKYTPVQFKYDDEIQLKENLGKLHNILSDDGAAKMTKTTLIQPTLDLVQLIFTEDQLYKKLTRFDLYEGNERMKKFEIGLKGVEYIPLGIPTNTQLIKGLSLLKEIGDHIIHHATTEQHRQLSSDFYRTVPCLIEHVERAVIDDTGKVKQLRDVILVLGGVTNCLKTVDDAKENKGGIIPHPLDAHHKDVVKCKIEHLSDTSDEYKMILKNIEMTRNGSCEWDGKETLLNIWKVDREPELTSFAAHEDLGNRRLLWRACRRLYEFPYILKEGYTISQRRDRFASHAGWGLYFRPCFDEAAKHVDVENRVDNNAVLFLMEVALGNSEETDEYDRDVTYLEEEYDSLTARGRQEPDLSQDVVLKLDGNDVTFSLGAPIAQEKYSEAEFNFTKYVLFTKSQYRIRYVCLFSRDTEFT
ncbi:protein mono-ADP-ribosyltransferase PARP3-like [Lytechinus pictus]|uniref:protein mono-ADP-ribosyltransferase PARP3-like n=1 Tax=Lytechinus pictus TaxID=7653 RepID=UPI0030BA2944